MKHQCTGKKRKVNDLNSDGMDESPLAGDEIYEKELEKIIVKDNNKYIKKLELGKMIYEMVGEGVVPVLPRHMKEQVDLYLKTSVESFPTDVELKPWQNELMKYIKPHDREIIWVVGKNGNEGKSGFINMLNL